MNREFLVCPKSAPVSVKKDWTNWSERKKLDWLMAPRKNPLGSAPQEAEPCGKFRSCTFLDGKVRWIVMLKHAHKSGDVVPIVRAKDGAVQEITLGMPLEVISVGKPIYHCCPN
jgi:hypothetical protein